MRRDVVLPIQPIAFLTFSLSSPPWHLKAPFITCARREVFLSCPYSPSSIWTGLTLQGAFAWTVRSLRTQKTITFITIVVRPNWATCYKEKISSLS